MEKGDKSRLTKSVSGSLPERTTPDCVTLNSKPMAQGPRLHMTSFKNNYKRPQQTPLSAISERDLPPPRTSSP